MKTVDVIINYNRHRPCEYVNVDMRFDISITTMKVPINNPDAKSVRKIHFTTVSNVK